MDQTAERSCGSNGLALAKSFGNSSGGHAPGAYPFVPYVCPNAIPEYANSPTKTATADKKCFRVLFLRLSVPISLDRLFRKHAAVGKNDASKRHPWCAGPGGMACNRNLVPELEHVLPEPRAGLQVWVTQFGAPMLHVPLVVRYVTKKDALWISPNPFGYSSRQCDLLSV